MPVRGGRRDEPGQRELDTLRAPRLDRLLGACVEVVDFRRDLGAASSYVEHELPGFSMYLDTNSIQNYDKAKVIQALQQAAEKLRDKIIP